MNVLGLLFLLAAVAAVFIVVMRHLDRRTRNLAAYERWVAEQERVPPETDAWKP